MSYLCVDGGQTKTTVYLLDGEGKTIESWKEGPLTTPSKPGAADNLRLVVRSLCEELRRRSSDTPQAACFSLTGYHEGDELLPLLVRGEVRKVVPNLEKVHVVPDYVGNWAAATPREPGIMVLSGGGVVAYGCDASGDSSN
jgi:N-acetylglucosamine kinase-like BadF-type ATPase